VTRDVRLSGISFPCTRTTHCYSHARLTTHCHFLANHLTLDRHADSWDPLSLDRLHPLSRPFSRALGPPLPPTLTSFESLPSRLAAGVASTTFQAQEAAVNKTKLVLNLPHRQAHRHGHHHRYPRAMTLAPRLPCLQAQCRQ
jgi:hypothetical protein